MTTSGETIGMLRAVRVAGPGREYLMDDEPVDIVIDGGRIVDIAPTDVLRPRGEIIDGGGCYVVPGLWDQHVHMTQQALAHERTDVGAASSAVDAAARIAGVAPLVDGRRVGSGIRDGLWPDAPTLDVLDAATGDVPTYVINADVHSVWLNSAALRREGFAAGDGMLREADAFEIQRRLGAVDVRHADAAVAHAVRAASARGVVGIVDFEMAWNPGEWARREAAGVDGIRVDAAVYAEDLTRAAAEGLRTGDALTASGRLRMGALKIIADGSLGTRTAACSQPYADGSGVGSLNLDTAELLDLLTTATGEGIAVAVHAIGDRAAAAALDAITFTGATGTIEHAQLLRQGDLARMARLGIAASIQPQHAVDDRDLAEALWSRQVSASYPMASLVAAGVDVRLGSDAPVAPLDPWGTLAAATTRTADAREPWHPEERLTVEAALAASTRTAVRPGEPADLVLCGADPLAVSGEDLRRMPVAATLLAGRVTHLA